ncbi:phenylalanyl-trna synthetase [Lasius niger]|uniref:Phenylalanyl-trna synthetase n=1 Tax=Lasius niger TaxID=67767 RepID=A0A0J7KH93_LASNI|nr:phenylalanyl-trna synthetase [Lasius niger]
MVVPRVDVDPKTDCYRLHGMKMVTWGNLLQSQKETKDEVKRFQLKKAQKKALVYSNIAPGWGENNEPVPDLTLAVQNILSIPITAMISATEMPSLKKATTNCQKPPAAAVEKILSEDEKP